MAHQELVPRTPTFFSKKSSHSAIKGRLTKGSSKPTSSSYPKLNNAIISVGCLRKRETLLFHQEEKVLSQLTHRPGIGSIAGMLNKTLIQFDVM